MDKTLIKRLLYTAVCVGYAAAIIFLGLHLFTTPEGNGLLVGGLACNVLGGLFNLTATFGRK